MALLAAALSSCAPAESPAPGPDSPQSAARASAIAEARRLVAAGRPGAALAVLEPQRGAGPGMIDVLALRGQALFALGRHDEAERAYAEASRLAPQIADLHSNRAMSLVEGSRLMLGSQFVLVDRVRDAEMAFARARELAPGDVRHPHGQALARELLFDLEGAAALYRSALEIDGDHVPSLRALGDALLRQGGAEAALVPLLRARELAPEDPIVAYAAGKALLRAGRTDEAIVALEDAARLDPFSREAAFNLAMALLRAGRTEEGEAARARFEEFGRSMLDSDSMRAASLAGGAGDPRFHRMMGLQYEQAGRIGDAMERFARSLALDEAQPDLHLRLGALMLRDGRAAEAEGHLRRAVSLAPEDAVARVHLAAALEAQGRLAEAAGEAREAARLAPGNFHARAALASVLERMGDVEGARREGEAAERIRAGAAP